MAPFVRLFLCLEQKYLKDNKLKKEHMTRKYLSHAARLYLISDSLYF